MKSVDYLRSMDVFDGVAEEDLHKIAALLKEKRVAKDAVIFNQGDTGDALYIVLSGRIKCFTTDSVGRERILGFFSDGQFFGEMAVLTGEPRSATMQAVSDARLLVLRKEDFDGFLAHNVQVMLHMMKVIAQRQAATNVRLARGDGAEAAPTGPAGKVFTVFSPKGGVGKSMLAVNLAVALAHDHAESVALVDVSLTFGHTLLMLNLVPKTSLASTTGDALRKMGLQEGLAYYLVVHPSSSLRILAGSTKPEEGEAVSGDAAKAALEQLKKHFNYVVVDTGCNFGDPVLAALENSDRVLMLCSPEIAVLRDIRECQRIFNDVVHLKKDKVLYFLNNLFPHKGLTREQFEDTLQQPLYYEIPYGGDTPIKASLRGEAFVESQPGSAIAKAVQKLAAQLAAEVAARPAAAQQEKKKGFFR